LLSKRDCRFAERENISEDGPEVALIFFRKTFAANTEGLAWTRGGSDWFIVGPSREPEGV
jgi:hypothetical protein